MKKVKRIILVVVVILIACLSCFLAGKHIANSPENQKMSAVVIENQLSEISQLATMNYSYTNMAEFESSKDFYGMKVPFTTKSFIITYDGEIKAGIDLTAAKVTVSGKNITITLPETTILSHQIDEASIKVFDEKTSIFNPFKVEDYKAFATDQKKEMEAKAKEKGLLTEAKEKAIQNVKSLMGQIISDDYTLTVK